MTPMPFITVTAADFSHSHDIQSPTTLASPTSASNSNINIQASPNMPPASPQININLTPTMNSSDPSSATSPNLWPAPFETFNFDQYRNTYTIPPSPALLSSAPPSPLLQDLEFELEASLASTLNEKHPNQPQRRDSGLISSLSDDLSVQLSALSNAPPKSPMMAPIQQQHQQRPSTAKSASLSRPTPQRSSSDSLPVPLHHQYHIHHHHGHRSQTIPAPNSPLLSPLLTTTNTSIPNNNNLSAGGNFSPSASPVLGLQALHPPGTPTTVQQDGGNRVGTVTVSDIFLFQSPPQNLGVQMASNNNNNGAGMGMASPHLGVAAGMNLGFEGMGIPGNMNMDMNMGMGGMNMNEDEMLQLLNSALANPVMAGANGAGGNSNSMSMSGGLSSQSSFPKLPNPDILLNDSQFPTSFHGTNSTSSVPGTPLMGSAIHSVPSSPHPFNMGGLGGFHSPIGGVGVPPSPLLLMRESGGGGGGGFGGHSGIPITALEEFENTMQMELEMGDGALVPGHHDGNRAGASSAGTLTSSSSSLFGVGAGMGMEAGMSGMMNFEGMSMEDVNEIERLLSNVQQGGALVDGNHLQPQQHGQAGQHEDPEEMLRNLLMMDPQFGGGGDGVQMNHKGMTSSSSSTTFVGVGGTGSMDILGGGMTSSSPVSSVHTTPASTPHMNAVDHTKISNMNNTSSSSSSSGATPVPPRSPLAAPRSPLVGSASSLRVSSFPSALSPHLSPHHHHPYQRPQPQIQSQHHAIHTSHHSNSLPISLPTSRNNSAASTSGSLPSSSSPIHNNGFSFTFPNSSSNSGGKITTPTGSLTNSSPFLNFNMNHIGISGGAVTLDPLEEFEDAHQKQQQQQQHQHQHHQFQQHEQLQQLKEMERLFTEKTHDSVGDLDALLLASLGGGATGVGNGGQGRF
jgi:hypothetical protein